MEENNIPNGLPFYIEITQTVVPAEEDTPDKREKLHELTDNEVKKAVTVSTYPRAAKRNVWTDSMSFHGCSTQRAPRYAP